MYTNKDKNAFNCEFTHCIYNKQKKCVLDTVSINSLGMCENCIIPDVPAKTIEHYKKITLKSLHGD